MKATELTFKEGDKIESKSKFAGGLRLEIMAIRKGYVMARYKGAVPFVRTIKGIILIIEELKQKIKEIT